MYLQYFGLKENPFALTPDPRYLYKSRRHEEALAHLLYGITAGGGFGVLAGEVGTGKTLMIRALLERLPPNVDVALVLYPMLSVREFVALICDDLRVPYPKGTESLKTLIDALNAYLLANHAKGRRTVLIIDEAHRLSHGVLEQVRLLTNLETAKEKLLHILLIGQPELNALLAQRDLRQLAQRVTARYDLAPLSRTETGQYVAVRLRVAGAQPPLFTRAALYLVHRLAGGIPRRINVICDRALLGAYAHGRNQVSAAIVWRAVRELRPAPQATASKVAVRIGVAAALLGAVAFAGWRLAPPLAPLPAPEPPPAAAAPVEPVTPPQPSPPPQPAAPPAPALADLLADPRVANGESAFTALFALWHLDYRQLPGDNACARAEQGGLQCLFATGTWNNLRQYNRPAVIELYDKAGERRHVLVAQLNDDITLEFAGGEQRRFALAEVDRHWLGKYLLLAEPPPAGVLNLRRGSSGEPVAWLREQLARAAGHPVGLGTSFDVQLEHEVLEFQRRHGIPADGVVGRLTLLQLANYDPEVSPPRLWRAEEARTP
jgi:general secretion pathway protein A